MLSPLIPSGPLPVLYSFRRCPYAIRARIALRKAGIPLELREIVLRDKPQAMLTLSPKGTVPVLCTVEGRVIDESLDIMRWALAQSDPDAWLDGADDPTQREWLVRNDGAFKRALDRYKYAERHPEHTAEEWRNQAVDALIAPMERVLSRQAYLAGERIGLSDAALFPFVRQFAAVDTGWFGASPYEATRRWLGGWLASADYLSVMDKLPVWQADGHVAPVRWGIAATAQG